MSVPKELDFRNHMGWNRRPWVRVHPYTNRGRRVLKVIRFLALALGTYHLLSCTCSHRRALREKFSPTTYHGLDQEASLTDQHWRWEDGRVPEERQRLWEHRQEWRRLGSGAEGEAFAFNGTVVKVYKSVEFPFRNCIPDEIPELRWPTEISASLLLGGIENSQDRRNGNGFLPVRDYFLSPATKDTPSRWHFLTPFLPSGNLIDLAGRLRSSSHSHAARDLDMIFRPYFEGLLGALHKMHTQAGLCHDDVKPGNVFVTGSHGTEEEDPKAAGCWVLGDLGNVRELSHPYHSSMLWTRVGNNLEDCRVNDVLRLLKSYMMFLRGSVQDVAAFDSQFLEGKEPWSRLFWGAWQEIQEQRIRTGPAKRVEMASLEMDPFAPEEEASGLGQRPSTSWGVFLWGLWSREAAMAAAVHEKLRIRAADHVSRRWGMVWLLGVPVGECKS